MSDNKPVQVGVRLPRDLMKRVDHLGVEWDTFRAETIRRLLIIALEHVPEAR